MTEKPAPAREAALALLARRSYSAGELTKKLLEKGFAPREAAGATEWLLSLKYLDDEAYARDQAQAYADKGFGRFRIRRELLDRALEEDLVARILAELPEADEVIDAMITQLSNGRNLSDPRQRRRLSDALARRGFAWEEINAAFWRLNEGLGMRNEE